MGNSTSRTSLRVMGAAAVVVAIACAVAPLAAQEPAPAAAATAESAPAAQEPAAAPAPAAPSRPWPPPMYNDRRFEENWRPIDWANPHQGSRDIFDPIKALKLNDSGSVWVGFGGQGRGRMARQSTVYFGGNGDFDPTMWTWRARAHADLHLGERFRIFGEGIYSYTTINEFRLGSIPEAPNLNGDVLNAFAEYNSGGQDWRVGVWGGRRELQMGHERMLSPGNWLLNRHTFDGGGAWLENGTHRVEAFVTRPRIPVPDMYSTRDDETVFSGTFYTRTFARPAPMFPGTTTPIGRETRVTVQPYLLHIKRDDVTFVQGTADEHRFTFGLLTYGDVGQTGFDFEYEGMYQYGRYDNGFDGGTIHANSQTIEFGYRLPTLRYLPRPSVSLDYASGDGDPNDDRLNTFDPLYPLAYAFFGFHAAFDRKNFVAPGLHLDLVLRRNMFLRTNYWPRFWRANVNDGYYNTFNALIRRPEPQSRGRGYEDLQEASRTLGSQWDVGVAWLPTHHLLIYGTYLRFNAGQFFYDTQTAPTANMNGVMVLTQFTF